MPFCMSRACQHYSYKVTITMSFIFPNNSGMEKFIFVACAVLRPYYVALRKGHFCSFFNKG